MKYLYIFFIIGFLTGCDSAPEEKLIVGEALGTTYQIKYFTSEEIGMQEALDSIFERVNQSMSTYRKESDISRLNRGEKVVVDSLFRHVYELSEQVYEESGGYFDPTVGNLVNYYGFGPDSEEMDPVKIDSLMRYVGLPLVRISSKGVVDKQFPQVYLDFNAIAKGYTIDLIGHYLDSNGIEHYLIELGGELLASGKNLEKDAPWVVGIDDPAQTESERKLAAAIALIDRAMATSGNYRKTRVDEETGRLYVHTVNPLTGLAEKSDILSASVLAENCALADAYATAFMAMGFERSQGFLEKLDNVDVYLIYVDQDGETKIFMTPEVEDLLVEL